MLFEERKKAWRELYDGGRQSVVMLYFDDNERPWPYPENKRARIDWALKTYRAQCERAAWLKDDRVPFLSPYTGTEIFAQAFGCEVHLPGDNMPFALPLVESTAEAAKLKTPDPEGALRAVWDIAEALHAAEPDAVLALPDIQSPLDIAALIWEKTDFYAALLTEPEAVLELTEKVYTLLTGFLDRWFDRFGRAFVAHYPDYYMPYGVTLSEDEVGVISPALFERFCLPTLGALSDRYGMIGIHCCAEAKHQWGLLKNIPGFTLFNLSPYRNVEETAREASIYFRDGPPLWLRGPDMNTYHDFRSRAVLLANADSKDEAIGELRRLREYSSQFKK